MLIHCVISSRCYYLSYLGCFERTLSKRSAVYCPQQPQNTDIDQCIHRRTIIPVYCITSHCTKRHKSFRIPSHTRTLSPLSLDSLRSPTRKTVFLYPAGSCTRYTDGTNLQVRVKTRSIPTQIHKHLSQGWFVYPCESILHASRSSTLPIRSVRRPRTRHAVQSVPGCFPANHPSCNITARHTPAKREICAE